MWIEFNHFHFLVYMHISLLIAHCSLPHKLTYCIRYDMLFLFACMRPWHTSVFEYYISIYTQQYIYTKCTQTNEIVKLVASLRVQQFKNIFCFASICRVYLLWLKRNVMKYTRHSPFASKLIADTQNKTQTQNVKKKVEITMQTVMRYHARFVEHHYTTLPFQPKLCAKRKID